jgi:hypothetical protein
VGDDHGWTSSTTLLMPSKSFWFFLDREP